VAEAGVLLSDIIATFLPRGWFPWSRPGTKFVSLGGAIAADVHGKNHHGTGSFRACVDWVEVMEAGRRAAHRPGSPTPRPSTASVARWA
jgi:decaprenylphospho-beta-D-ribofuranose 2-oxidase